ncbi:MAG: hypothetical protein ACLR8P_18570 [Clostridium fessum]
MAVGIIFRLQHLCDAFQYRLAGNPVVDVSGNDSDSRVSALSDSEGRRTHQPYAVVRLGSDGSGAVPFFYFAANAHAIIKLATRVTKNPVYGADGDSGGALADGTLQALCGNPDSLCGRCTACIYICDGAFWKGYL